MENKIGDLKVLIGGVMDNAMVVHDMTSYLSGYLGLLPSNIRAERCLELLPGFLEEQNPDIVIIDMRLSPGAEGGCGFYCLKLIKEFWGASVIPIAEYTEEAKRLREKGFPNALSIPFQCGRELQALIKRAVPMDIGKARIFVLHSDKLFCEFFGHLLLSFGAGEENIQTVEDISELLPDGLGDFDLVICAMDTLIVAGEALEIDILDGSYGARFLFCSDGNCHRRHPNGHTRFSPMEAGGVRRALVKLRFRMAI